MSELFISLFNMSITAVLPILFIIIFRAVFKKVPKSIICILWLLAALRLIIPDFIESPVSIIPSTETVPHNILVTEVPSISSGLSYLNSVVNPVIGEALAPTPESSVTPMQIITSAASFIWIIGTALMIGYAVVSYINIRRRVRESIRDDGNIFLCDRISSPFILGIFRPRIYLPSDIGGSDREYVVAHERCHLKRLDHLIKPIAFLILSVYWFNPFVWLSYILLSRDIEFACDEGVIRRMGGDCKKGYSEALINCSSPSRLISACPLAFGEVGVKSRIRQVLNYKKPAFWIIILAIIAAAVLTACLLTNPKKDESPDIPILDIGDDEQGDKSPLTLEKLIELSKKGKELTWSDFDGYIGFDIGSGLFIMRYDIDEMFYVLVGGGSPLSEPPLYIRLYANTMNRDCVDMTQDDVEAFINSIKGQTPVRRISHRWSVSRVGYNDATFNRLCNLYGIPKNANLNSVKSLPVIKITSVNDLNKFMENLDGYMYFGREIGDDPSFREVAEKFDGEFFLENTLILIYNPSGSFDARYVIDDAVVYENDKLFFGISDVYDGPNSFMEEGWLLSVPVKNEDIKGVTTISASEIIPASYDEILSGDIKAQYVFRNTQDVIKPSLVLFDNNKFRFAYSGLSSYLAIGNYEEKDGRFILNTYDGTHTYVFRINDNGITFLESESNGGYMFEVKEGTFFEKVLGKAPQ
ncbi:MAG: hypothetical protein IKT70_10880 [Clostridia bacterium]|nr:hypothetical protein [Clostridia bacterium]